MLRVKLSRKKGNKCAGDRGDVDGDQNATLRREIRLCLIEKVTFEQRLQEVDSNRLEST